ncbi:kunitz-type protease inhibitor 1-like isoform X2 [Scyliorhinus torazame]|uniref:kunitz-type protease inhibitor 1-like isoform X2 n=1 Tax=Scyliorhinus torazame TaxID=75743 RepID=UPI003B5B0FB5
MYPRLLPVLLLLSPALSQLDPSSAHHQCLQQYRLGRDDFVLDTDDSVAAGATFLGAPNATRARDCVSLCCRTRGCNVVLLEDLKQQSQREPMLRLVKGCFLFNCLYNQVYVCRFFRREGYSNFIQGTVYEDYIRPREPTAGDKRPVANAGRDRIVQPDEEVTLSGVESRDDFKIVSFDWSLLHGNLSVKLQKTKNPDEKVVSNLQVGNYVFQLTVTDTAGQKTMDNMTIIVLSLEQSDEYCLVGEKVGPCRGAFPRWHYSTDRRTCEIFTYGGCKGNKNNYVDEKECKQACGGAKADSKSSGRSGLPLSKQFDQLLEIDIPKEKARCTYPPVTGRCRADFSRFYYNPYSRTCERFTYGGCDGNRFEKKDVCIQACKGVTEKDVFSRSLFERQKQGNSSNANVAIAVVLAICIAAVVAVLIYFLLKMKKENQQASAPSSTDSAEEMKKLVALQSKPV